MKEIVLDIETQNQFSDVGGPQNLRLLKVSLVGVYDYASDKYSVFMENEMGKLEGLIQSRDRIIGYNIRHFDFPVLRQYMKTDLSKINNLDLFVDIENQAGFKVGLDSVAQATLGEGKSGHGLKAIEYFQKGDMESLKKYCLDDVRLTKDIYEYGKKHRKVIFHARGVGERSIPVMWNSDKNSKTIEDILTEAQNKQVQVEIEYVSNQPKEGEEHKKKRTIEIYKIEDGIIDAYCHLSNGKRFFMVNKVLDAKLTDNGYSVPSLL